MRLPLLVLCLVVVAILTSSNTAVAQSTVAAGSSRAKPEFRLGFKALADQIPHVAGTPLEDEHYGANGDSLQQTTTGLMVWRKADNWTAFTDGNQTWVNGPAGIQERANNDRFPWEAAAATAPSSQNEVDLWDRRGVPTAYIAADDDNTIYLWSGQPMAYLYGNDVYGFNGNHLGWFQDGILWDYEGVSVGFSKQAPFVNQSSEPPKSARLPEPAKQPREAAPPEPPHTQGVYTELLSTLLGWGR